MPPKRSTVVLFFLLAFAIHSSAQTSSKNGTPTTPKPANSSNAPGNSIETRVEQYLRNAYAWGPNFKVKVGPVKPSPIPELLEVPVTVTMAAQSDTAIVYVNKAGNFLVRGELDDMSIDPLAEIRSKLNSGNSPSTGPQNAKITLIEFADFECPSCRQLDLILRDFLSKHPEIRLVYKHFPLTDIHPWAMTAAIASQCAYNQSPASFWKMHDAIFDAQDVISPENVWDKMIDLGTQLALNMDTYRSCMADPATAMSIQQTIAEGRTLNITGTPTTFINGRRIVGPDQNLIEQDLQYETLQN